MPFSCRRKVLEETGGFDEDLAYGEDYDLPKRIDEAGFERGQTGAAVHKKMISTIGGVWRQGRWYGKSLLDLFRKHPQILPTIMMFILFLTWVPILALSFVFWPFYLVSIPQTGLVLLYLLNGLYRTRDPYLLLAPFIKTIRSYAEAIGIVEGFLTEGYGRD